MALPALSRKGGRELQTAAATSFLLSFCQYIRHTSTAFIGWGTPPSLLPHFQTCPKSSQLFSQELHSILNLLATFGWTLAGLNFSSRFSQTDLLETKSLGGNPAGDTWSLVPGKNARKQEEEEPLYAPLWNCVGSLLSSILKTSWLARYIWLSLMTGNLSTLLVN